MEMRPYVDELCHEFLVAATGGGEDTRALAERLIGPLETATRLTACPPESSTPSSTL